MFLDDIQLAPCQRHSPTSRAAAARIAPKVGTKRAKVLEYLQSCVMGATDEEMQRDIPMAANTQRPRRVELLDGGFIKDSGHTRKTLGGDDAVVWVAVGGGE